MNDKVAIKVENVSKKYCKSLKRSMLYGVKDIGRNMLGMGSHSDRLRKSEFWAVDDVSFELKKGEASGIIGPNGSGKTTLLKLLNGIFWPDKGKITIKGKVGALIEVGAGFHPLLTGRENVYINAAILGMTKKEVDGKFDDIVGFADIGDFIDTPVKFYSSGMFVRLGFAVAVHCEPDILLVDEILAVGDASFQKKCMERMSLMRTRSTTILFVSHSMANVAMICDKVALIDKGSIIKIGDPDEVIEYYLGEFGRGKPVGSRSDLYAHAVHSNTLEIEKTVILNDKGDEVSEIRYGDDLIIRIYYNLKETLGNVYFIIFIKTYYSYYLSANMYYDKTKTRYLKGKGFIDCIFRSVPLLPETYRVVCDIRLGGGHIIQQQTLTSFRVKRSLNDYGFKGKLRSVTQGAYGIYWPYEWRFSDENPES